MLDSPSAARYVPQPVDNSTLPLPAELSALLESLAENAHEVWARQRVREGWSYGPARDDVARHHPGLVPYAQLPEAEKEYDRLMAAETLRFILGHGHRIVPREHERGGTTSSPLRDEDVQDVLAEIRGAQRARQLMEIWALHDREAWTAHPDLYLRLARRLIDVGEPFLAQEVLQTARLVTSSNPLLRYLEGLAASRAGAAMQAYSIARELSAMIPPSATSFYEDVLGLLGRTAKDLAVQARDSGERRDWLARSLDAYQRAFDVTRGSYSGVNAATVALLAGDVSRARALAAAVRDIATSELKKLEHTGNATFWQYATLAECALLAGDLSGARERYQEASNLGGVQWGDVASTRRQARLICAEQRVDADWLDEVLRIPTVVVFAGHRVDDAERAHPRFPASAESRVRDAIRERLIALHAGFGFSGAANGGDILFQEAMRDIGGETFIVLPYDRAEYLETSVVTRTGGDWRRRFEQVLESAAEPAIATGQKSVDMGVLFDYAHVLLLGFAALQARAIESRVIPLVLWDGEERDALTGTAAAVAAWRRAGHMVEVIDIRKIVTAKDK